MKALSSSEMVHSTQKRVPRSKVTRREVKKLDIMGNSRVFGGILEYYDGLESDLSDFVGIESFPIRSLHFRELSTQNPFKLT